MPEAKIDHAEGESQTGYFLYDFEKNKGRALSLEEGQRIFQQKRSENVRELCEA